MSSRVVLPSGIISSGNNVYFDVQNEDGDIYDTSTSTTFSAPNVINYPVNGGTIIAEVSTTSQYEGDFPSTIAAGTYNINVKQRSGASPAFTDQVLQIQRRYWDGTDLLDPAYASVIGAGAISATFVEDSHIWRFSARDQMTAENVINEVVDFIGLLAMNFDNVISENVRIQSALVDSIDGDTGTSSGIDTTGSVQLSPNNRRVLIPIQVYDDGTYTFIIKITTTDTQTFVRRGVVSITPKVET